MSATNLSVSLSGTVSTGTFNSGTIAKGFDSVTSPAQFINDTQIIGTAAEAITLGDITAGKVILLVNRDATNFVEIAIDSGMTNKFAKLQPGFALLLQPISGVTYYAKADTAACTIAKTAVDG